MKHTTITKEILATKGDKIGAEFIRWNRSQWTLVGYKMHKTVTREEGLKIKNQYGMRETGTGYTGYIPTSVFEGGRIAMEDI